MRLSLPLTTCLVILLLMACSDHSNDPEPDNRASMRDLRYCEVAFFFLGAEGITSATYNSFEFNDCAPADWASLDFKAIRKELSAVAVRPNGPRRWLMDMAELEGAEDADRRFLGNLEFRLVANIQFDSPPPPPGIFFSDARIRRDSRFLFFKDRPVYELLAPLGKRYVMQSYAQIVEPTLSLADLETLGPKLSLPEGWLYRPRLLDEDLVVEDFQGLATAVRDPLENTYQRAEILEILSPGTIAVEIFNPINGQSWTSYMSEQEADALELLPPWQKAEGSIVADKSVYSRSPEAILDGRFSMQSFDGRRFYHSGSQACSPELHASGLVFINQSRRFQELTYRAGRTVPYVTDPSGVHYVLVTNTPDRTPAALPAGWRRAEVTLSKDWRIVFDGHASTVMSVDGENIFQGPVLLPGLALREDVGSSFTLKLLQSTGENPFANLVYECDACTFEQHAAIQPPPGWSKGATQAILPQGQLQSLPCFDDIPSTVDFVPGIPGNEFKLIGKNLSGSLVEIGPNGLMVLGQVMRDTLFRYPAGSRVHELTDPEGNVYILFAYEVDSFDFATPDFQDSNALLEYPRPSGWSYSTRILNSELVIGSGGVASVLSIQGAFPSSTWEKY